MAAVDAPPASTSAPVESETHPGSRGGSDLRALVELTGSLATRHDIHEILFLVVSRLAELLQVDRGSIVLWGDDPNEASVVATSDDREITNLALDLDKYPEIRSVLDGAEPLVIDDVSESTLLHEVLRTEGPLEFTSMALVPITGENGPLAVLCLKGRQRTRFSESDLLRARAVANATAIALNNARILRRLRAETSSRLAEDSKRLVELGRYFDFFESSADAMLVMDASGLVLLANPTMQMLTGQPSSLLLGKNFLEFVDKSSLARLERIIDGFTREEYPVGVDLRLKTAGGTSRLACVNFSHVLHDNGAVLATMRDVTRERELGRELGQTKEFLERMIESSVDSIVSADLRGNVLLFNRAAERLFGYSKHEVLQKITVDKLYPPGVARDIMRRIRGPEYGGKDRLEDYRVDMLTKDGERIVVTLSASLVLDGVRPIATLGIFTDIREKLAMEARLRDAQRELQQHEKQSAIAELAGAAAHELNQPLTSVMGYAEYLKRSAGDDPQFEKAIRIILSEAERMAEIVRKVGRITHYRTKPYVGQSQIVDLDQSSSDAPPEDTNE